MRVKRGIIKRLAQERGLTSEELAYKARVKISTVRNVIQGRSKDPNASTLIAIARVLEVSVESLVEEEDEIDMQTPLPVAA